MKNYILKFSLLLTILVISCSPKLKDPLAEADFVTWYDDYYTLQYIDSTTIAIGEPRYHQRNYSYLVIGTERAILFDTGPGIRNIEPVVQSLTNLPIMVTQSHLHYDHVGNHARFEGAYLPDLPQLRERSENGFFKAKSKEHLGFVENIKSPKIKVKNWWAMDTIIDLGERKLRIIHTPGHTEESISIYDLERKYLFSGDFLCPGPNLAAVPGSDLNEYLESTNVLLDVTGPEIKLLAGHRNELAEKEGAPMLGYSDLIDLKKGLEAIISDTKKGKGFIIKNYKINDRIELITDL